jgi:hypothetical protein
VEFKCFKKMKALEAKLKKNNISIDSSSSFHGHALFYSSFSFNATSNSFDEWLIDYGESYLMAKDKSIFFLLMNVTPRKYLSVMIDLLVL